ncbi:MAG: hypothetical protein OXT09_17610 [Myxococcales bacterium]|nr:hypothetical protein [Myxococcales bacterium]
MTEPTKDELLQTEPGTFDTESLSFEGLRGDRSKHLDRGALVDGIAALPAPPRDEGRLELLVARGPAGERVLPTDVELTVEGGLPGDRWAGDDRYGPRYQLATTRADLARLIANGQPLELHGDNLYVDLDLSTQNLPAGTRVRLGKALLRVTEQPHNGCKKWVQRFGLDAMQLNLHPDFRAMRIRGIYFQVVEPGIVRVGDTITVLERPPA